MAAARSRRFRLALLLASGLALLTQPTASRAYTQEEQAACSGDAFRLCGPEIPDVDRVTACMVRNMAQLSPGCRVYFRSGPEAAAVPAGAPISIKPATLRKPVSAKKAAKTDAKTDAKATAKPGKSKKPKNPDTT
jgi:hypothetical protein